MATGTGTAGSFGIMQEQSEELLASVGGVKDDQHQPEDVIAQAGPRRGAGASQHGVSQKSTFGEAVRFKKSHEKQFIHSVNVAVGGRKRHSCNAKLRRASRCSKKVRKQ